MPRVHIATNIENDDLTCPITLELFRDPVLAGDGHVYEREAITRWILEHGTSPFTREPLQINDLEPDDHLRRLAARRRRRTSTVSYNARDATVSFSTRQTVSNTTTEMNPNPTTSNLAQTTKLLKSDRCKCIFCCIVTLLVAGALVTGIVIYVIYGPKSSSDIANVTSTYSGELTNNSSIFTRPGTVTGQFYYQLIQINLPPGGRGSGPAYQLQSISSIDMYGCLYYRYFNPTNILVNLRQCDDNSGPNQQFLFWGLVAMYTYDYYYLVATTYASNVTGSFSIQVTGPKSISFG